MEISDYKTFWNDKTNVMYGQLKMIDLIKSRRDKSEFDFIVETIKQHNIKSVLEIGCGAGIIYEFLKQNCTALKYDGYDIAEKQIELFEVFHTKKVKTDLSKIKSKSYDLVFTHSVLMHIEFEHVKELFAEMKRIAKKVILLNEFSTLGEPFNKTLAPFNYNHNYTELTSFVDVKRHEFNRKSFVLC